MVAIITYYEARHDYNDEVDGWENEILHNSNDEPLRSNNLEKIRAEAQKVKKDYLQYRPTNRLSFYIVKITVSEIGGKFSYEESIVEEL